MKVELAILAVACAAACNSFASNLVYLSCDLPAQEDRPASHFDFTLDEQNSSVTYFVKEANATNKESAVFGPDRITWSTNTRFVSSSRAIDRTDLSFTQEVTVGNIKNRQVGSCALIKAPNRKF